MVNNYGYDLINSAGETFIFEFLGRLL